MPRHDDLTRAVCPDCGYTLFIASPWTKLGTPICPQCYLSCQVAETTCFVCNGTGQKRLHVFGVRTNFVTCDRCDGTGTLREAGAA